MKFEELIKNKRIKLKETQEEFGKRFNVSHASVSDWESGKSAAPYKVLYFILNDRCEDCLANLHDQRIIELESRVENIEGFLNL